jgi:hypothetical protein
VAKFFCCAIFNSLVTDKNTPQSQYNTALKGITQIIKSSDNADLKVKADALLTILTAQEMMVIRS